jgi:hypothetical protein
MAVIAPLVRAGDMRGAAAAAFALLTDARYLCTPASSVLVYLAAVTF